jgi:ATP-dependent DNA helicase RecQ
VSNAPLLPALLQQYFGFSAFRPLQQEIIHDALAGKDVLALLPTGGGKSLCFQLTALARPGLTIVVSPLIALMKDQVDALLASGISATFLNSTLAAGEARERFQNLERGTYKLLYVAPERLMIASFLDSLQRWNVSLFAIDEAHCISEWGHDFRPEYRQLATLRDRFPTTPVMALTATATERVRQDIAAQLNLRSPKFYVASFNRPNLKYAVSPKTGAYEQILDFIRKRSEESGIIYCQSRKGAESLAQKLREDRIAAAPYHAGMESPDRARQQDAFLRDDVRVMCATIAFGMGINKPNVRYVIHYDLPKNIESYYQETGRAGRDGLPSDCLLLFSAGDRVKYERFIDEKPPEEREAARAQLELMVHYAEDSACRRKYLLEYFGETLALDNCGSCDNCLSPRESWDATTAAQKFISCVYRIREKSGFGVGVGHVAEVLTGGQSEKILKWGHDSLSTYSIGKEHSRQEWTGIGRELVRLGLLRQNAERFNVLELTEDGRTALKTRRQILLTRAMTAPELSTTRAGTIECDEALFAKLRELRKRLADERRVPAYIVFSDVALRFMARDYPKNEHEMRRVPGVGERKYEEFGEIFLNAIGDYLKANPHLAAAPKPTPPPNAARPTRTVNDTTGETLRLLEQGKSVDEIAQFRDLTPGTIYQHIVTAIESGRLRDVNQFFDAAAREEIKGAFEKLGPANLTGIFELLSAKYSYGQLRVFRALDQVQNLPSGSA